MRRFLMLRWRSCGLHAHFNAVIERGVTIRSAWCITLGPYAKIGYGSSIICDPGTFHMGAFASMSEGCWVSSTRSVRLEPYAMMGPGCYITDANHGFNGDAHIMFQPRAAAPVVIGEGAWLGADTKVLSGVHVGRGAVVGAGSVVTRNVPDYAIVAGVPATAIGKRRPPAPPAETLDGTIQRAEYHASTSPNRR